MSRTSKGKEEGQGQLDKSQAVSMACGLTKCHEVLSRLGCIACGLTRCNNAATRQYMFVWVVGWYPLPY